MNFVYLKLVMNFYAHNNIQYVFINFEKKDIPYFLLLLEVKIESPTDNKNIPKGYSTSC